MGKENDQLKIKKIAEIKRKQKVIYESLSSYSGIHKLYDFLESSERQSLEEELNSDINLL